MSYTRLNPTQTGYCIGRTVTVQSSGVSLAADASSDSTISLTSYGFTNTPIAIPSSNGWSTTEIVSVTAKELKLRAWNFSSGSHTCYARALLIELI